MSRRISRLVATFVLSGGLALAVASSGCSSSSTPPVDGGRGGTGGGGGTGGSGGTGGIDAGHDAPDTGVDAGHDAADASDAGG
jgi:hypothetical protein